MKLKKCKTAVQWKIKAGIIIGLLLMFCIFSGCIYIRFAEGCRAFRAPEHESMAVKGIPGGENLWHYEEIPVKDGYVVGIDTNPHYSEGRLYLNVTNCEGNTVWFLVRIYQEDKLIAETGIFYPGEFVGDISCDEKIDDSDSILIKILAYEPDTYHSEGVIQISCAVTSE